MFSPLKLPGSPIQFHPVSLPGNPPRKGLLLNRKFTSICDAPAWLKNVCIRTLGLPTLMPDCPPSPKMLTKPLPFLPLMPWVPLSCVPPIRSLSGFWTLTDRLWYWSVPSPLFIDEIVVGTFESQLLQSIRLFPVSPRPAHWLCTSLNDPFILQTPPSSPLKRMFGLNGVAAIACWSGCRLTPCVSMVMSVKFTPASSERWTARPFERPPISEYCIELPM